MIRSNNILLTIFLFLLFLMGWENRAWAQNYPAVEGKIYTIKARFASTTNDSYLTNRNSTLVFPQTVEKTGSCWKVMASGDNTYPWKFQSVAEPTKYLNANESSGIGTSATNFAFPPTPVAGTYYMNGVINGAGRNIGTWGVTDPKTGFGKSGSGGCWSTGGHANSNWTTDYEIAEVLLLNGQTNIRFVDAGGNILTQGEVSYTKADGTVATISATSTTFLFEDRVCPVSAFAAVDRGFHLSVALNAGTLTFTLVRDPNAIAFSSAPSATDWAADTHWFTIRNNRSNQATLYNRTFLSTSALSVNDLCELLPNQTTMPNDRGSYWCFVGDNEHGFVIQNAAYGPHFVLGISGNNNMATVKMLPKDDIPSGYTTVFTAVSNSVVDDGNLAYAFRLNLTGNTHIHVTQGKFIIYNHTNISGGDTGSAFKLTAAETNVVNSLPALDVYKVDVDGAKLTYTGSRTVFGKRNASPYIILSRSGAEVTVSDISVRGFSLSNLSVAQPGATTYLKTITADVTIQLSQPNWYYIQNYNGNYYLSAGSGYLLADGALALSNTTQPTDYEGLWMEIPTGGFDADGNGVMYFVNAYSGDTKILALTGSDGNAKAKMYSLDELPANAKVFFERRFYTGHTGSFYYREENTSSNYLNNRSEGGRHLAFWNSGSAFGESGSRFAHSSVPNLTNGLTIHYEAESSDIEIPAGLEIIYQSLDRYRMVSGVATLISGMTQTLTEGVVFDFGDVPYLSRLFNTNNREFPLKGVRVEGGHIYFIIGQLPRILHRQSHLFTKLEGVTDPAQLPGDGFIRKGEGMTKNPYTGDSIQYTSNYIITQYIKHGVGKNLYMPTIDGNNSEVTAYQRWYDYQTEARPRVDVMNVPGYVAQAGEYLNGYVVGTNNNRGGIIKNAAANLPNDLSEYYLAVDQSRYNDGANHSNGDLTEPSITMRVIYHLIDAKVMADSMNACTQGSDNWIEHHKISFPNKKLWNNSNDTKSGVDYVGLNLEFSNYWCYDGQGTTDANLVQMTGTGNLSVELDPSSTAQIRNIKILANGDAGIKNVQAFARNRFIAFQYPQSLEVEENSFAIIKVYMVNASGTKFQLARIHLTFIGNAEPLLINEVYGKNADGSFKSLRSKEAMEATYGRPVSDLTFDHGDFLTFTCPGGSKDEAYAFPLDFKQSSYAYHGAPWASRGEYIFRRGGSAIGGKMFYPIECYKDALSSGSNTPTIKQGKYFLYVDASEQPGQVMSIPIPERLCVGSRMFCYGWFNSATQISQESVGIVINIVGKVNETDETGEIIYSYNPGLLSTWAFDSNNQPVSTICGSAPWRQVGFSFCIDSKMAGRYAAYEMQVMNNCYSTNGGDYTLDNFYIFVNAPKGNVDFTTPLCSDALRHVKVHTDYDMLIETSGVNVENPAATIPVSFCFLDKEIYDAQTKNYYDVDSLGKRSLKEEIDYSVDSIKLVFNKAFGDALIGERSIDKAVRGHGFHNFTVPVDYNSIETYAFNDSPDDYIFKEEMSNGERRIVFKEQLYQSNGTAHNWEPGKTYYLLFSPYHVTNDDVQHHEVGTHIFHISDLCCVLTTFSIMPPIEVKGDATITSSDNVKACDNQVVTFKVDMPALKLNDDATAVTDSVISGLNYDWWVGTSKENSTHAGFLAAKFGTYGSIEDARRYNHQAVNDYPDEADVKMDVYLSSALENIRFFFPEARTLDEITEMPHNNDHGYGVVAEHIACLAHYLEPMADGRKPLSLFGQTFNLKVSHAETDTKGKQHFVAIPIIPEQEYGVDEKLIYCPSPQELIIEVGPTAPNMQNGFAGRTYPASIENVPVRIGKMQVDAVRKDADTVKHTLNIPLRQIVVTGSESTQLKASDLGEIFLAATDDPRYSFDTHGGDFAMRQIAQVVDIHAPKAATNDAYLKIVFMSDFDIREGYTYTLKMPYVEDKDCECNGTMVFDLKVVPEYMIWTAEGGNSDWTNDANWARADRSELNADQAAMGEIITHATSLTSSAAYIDNEANKTRNGFVPMYFTNILIGENQVAPDLYEGVSPATETELLTGLRATATTDIRYDLSVTPTSEADRTNYNYDCNYTCEPFGTYVANGLTFLPGGRALHTERLSYHRAWVEYELDVNRWYTLSSPLQNMYAGEWYAPTGTNKLNAAKQLTPHFYDIRYSQQDCDRFRPAIYQRSWDSDDALTNVWMKDGSDCNAYITNDWSYVYNDVLQRYGVGGFSVKVSDDYMPQKPTDGKAIIRLPKADTTYTYYDVDGQTGQKADDLLPTSPTHARLWSDKLATPPSFQQTITNQTEGNNYFLIGNPFMANLDMEEFFRQNPQFEKTYWVLTEGGQTVSVRSAYAQAQDASVPDDERWLVTETDGLFGSDAAVVAPLQGFFVRTTGLTHTTTITYTATMQTLAEPVLKPLLSPQRPGGIEPIEQEMNPTDDLNEPIRIYTIDGRQITVQDPCLKAAPRVYIVDGKRMLIQ